MRDILDELLIRFDSGILTDRYVDSFLDEIRFNEYIKEDPADKSLPRKRIKRKRWRFGGFEK